MGGPGVLIGMRFWVCLVDFMVFVFWGSSGVCVGGDMPTCDRVRFTRGTDDVAMS